MRIYTITMKAWHYLHYL